MPYLPLANNDQALLAFKKELDISLTYILIDNPEGL